MSSNIDQVKGFVQNRSIPLPSVAFCKLKPVFEILQKAHDEVKRNYPNLFVVGKEECLNSQMCNTLKSYRWRDVDVDCYSLYAHVARGEEIMNYDGTKINKRPDISITLTDNIWNNFPLIIEAKIIVDHGIEYIKKYFENGVIRFVDGRYAWWSVDGVMMAYVLDNSNIKELTMKYISGLSQTELSELNVKNYPNVLKKIKNNSITNHNRFFKYVIPSSNPPGPITLWHIWLK